MLILNDANPLHWAAAGAVISIVTLILLFGMNRRLGISSGFENVCALVVRTPYFRRPELDGTASYRLPFLLGLLIGGTLSAIGTGGWAPTWELGMLDRALALGPAGKCAWMFGGGLLIGFGTRMAGGCTSGHGIFGVATFRRASLQTTATFMLTGIVTSHLIYRVWGPS